MKEEEEEVGPRNKRQHDSQSNTTPVSGNSNFSNNTFTNSTINDLLDKLESINLLSENFNENLDELKEAARKHYLEMSALFAHSSAREDVGLRQSQY